MSADDLSHAVPLTLDDPPKLLFWDWDVACIAMLGIMSGLGSGYPIVGFVIGIALAGVYSRFFKSDLHPGIAAHLIAWITGMPTPSDLPPTHLREFKG
ncbi:type IV conjugative transfer system protein TraL [Burkholderia stagnalis]|uniref:Type IV conjugative transfer system protein TraL n=1 Tax=Burkholderia stagnalis TaxID=1503054 RepID=A0ABX9YDN8_9BURK|nr:type IV conjugative transfer system protein TraL [Burkholderia stagnalis]RQQ48689.1 type IV conjugative transfer system protein TraL [Burkholderia stagnalis]RQQ60105.1 type IV conjugative transfer system protein TraL [Burkholderia stagnalis]RQQ60397.1 type IV conjugative transfer system protein TraL [Burkholderia stagnalis]RQQ75442.1 type IV conjugative transfer system protein TraL [Burkholderia stagnalis]RQQ80552.1 type IV conjugative transfer system protein TraL [Burkholderia stagnalis]